MRIYRRYLKKYGMMFVIGVTCVFFEAMCDLMQPTILARIVDDGIKASDMTIVLNLGGIMLLVSGIGACFAFARNWFSSTVSQSFGADLRSDLFKKMTKLSLSSVDRLESGSLITRITNDVTQVTHFVNGMMRFFFKAPLSGIGSIVLAVMLNPRLSLILFGVIGIVAIFISISMRMSYQRFARVQYALDRVNTVVQEYLMGVRLVKAFGRFKQEEERFETANNDLALKNVSAQRVITLFAPLMSLTVNLGIAATIYVGSLMFRAGTAQVGQIIAFTQYMTQIMAALMMIINIFNTFVRTKASTERIEEVLCQEEEPSGAGGINIDAAGTLKFEHVFFSYSEGGDKPVLKDISFEVGKGETLAVIGPTGSGKSTLGWLLLRFYDVTGGSIYLGSTNLTETEPYKVRKIVSIAPQQSMLFSGTVKENIGWGSPQADEQAVKAAAEAAQADEFILQMPKGYDSLLGQAGVNLSGGQRQRVSIARALVRDARVLILDDCTSALDAVTEAKVRQNLKNSTADGKIVVMITQRIGTAMGADKILVLDDGEMVGFGTHEELMQKCETYKDIYESQIGGAGECYA